jgi:DNA-binding transcriptional ArsR family regulator
MNSTLSTHAPGVSLRDFLAITKALADENRVRMLLVLRDREVCLCQLAEFIGLALSTASKHMSILRQAGLVETRKAGRWHYYRLAGPEAKPPVVDALRWVVGTLGETPQTRRDLERLQEALRAFPENVCRTPESPQESCGKGRGCPSRKRK